MGVVLLVRFYASGGGSWLFALVLRIVCPGIPGGKKCMLLIFFSLIENLTEKSLRSVLGKMLALVLFFLLLSLSMFDVPPANHFFFLGKQTTCRVESQPSVNLARGRTGKRKQVECGIKW